MITISLKLNKNIKQSATTPPRAAAPVDHAHDFWTVKDSARENCESYELCSSNTPSPPHLLIRPAKSNPHFRVNPFRCGHSGVVARKAKG